MKKITFAAILFLFCFQCWGQSPKTDYTKMLNVIDLWLDAQKNFDKLPGISVAIVHDQDIIFKKGITAGQALQLANTSRRYSSV